MEYKRVEKTGIVELWKEEKLIGQVYSVDELWKRRVYMTVGREFGKTKSKSKLKPAVGE